MFTYKIDVLESLKESGYNTTRLHKEGQISQAALQQIRRGQMVGIKSLHALCEMLDMQPGNIIKYVEDEK